MEYKEMQIVLFLMFLLEWLSVFPQATSFLHISSPSTLKWQLEEEKACELLVIVSTTSDMQLTQLNMKKTYKNRWMFDMKKTKFNIGNFWRKRKNW